MSDGEDAVRRRNAIAEYRKKLLQHKEYESRVRAGRENLRAAKKEFNKTEDDLKSLQSVGQIIGHVKMIMATNRPDVLDPALLRPGRLDRKIEIPLPNEQSRMEILKIHAAGIAKHGEIDYEAVVKLAEGFNGADLRNVCTEAGMSAIRAERDYVIHEDFMKAVRKLNEAKKLESSAHYSTDFGKE
ncbi:hypothetical protein E1A91_A03G095500v1 [Gossypium mustelinum]|uniref:AAA ATPase AAA+ lid domain-containing protein n=1 Tax=Gossypium mustelinum TaxID=34275 RepID=A0A5D2ZUA0_GOSMU|nr:hypothetical protein E1A91_A03G095500v1 [Gossypium mustelinum]